MAFDIRAIFARALGGREGRHAPLPVPAGEEMSDDEEMPTSPITAAGSSAASPDTADMSQGGATLSSAFIPEGVEAIPSAAIDTTSASMDEAVEDIQARRVAEVAIAAAIVNGTLGREEREDLVESLREIPGLDEYGDTDVREVMMQLRDLSAGEEPADFVAAMEDHLNDVANDLTDPALRRAAYQLGVYFAAWDGDLSDEESDLLEAMAEAFEISDFEARSLREATVVEAGEEGQVYGATV